MSLPSQILRTTIKTTSLSSFFKTLKKCEYSHTTDEPFFMSFTSRKSNTAKPLVIENIHLYKNIYKNIKKKSFLRIVDKNKAIFTAFNNREESLLEMTASYIYLDPNQNTDITDDMINQTHTLKSFIYECQNHIPHVKLNPIVIYELRFIENYNEDTYKAKYESKYFALHTNGIDKYCRYDSQWRGGYNLKDMKEPDRELKIIPNVKSNKSKPKPKQKNKKSKSNKQKPARDGEKTDESQDESQDVSQDKSQDESQDGTQETHETDSVDKDITDMTDTTDTTDTIDTDITENIVRHLNISFNRKGFFSYDERQHIKFLVNEFSARNPLFRLKMETEHTLCILAPIHYDNETKKRGEHFTAYFFNTDNPNNTLHFYIENDIITHITKRVVEVLF